MRHVNVEFYTDAGETLPEPVLIGQAAYRRTSAASGVLVADDVATPGPPSSSSGRCSPTTAIVHVAVLYEKPHTTYAPGLAWRSTDPWIRFPWIQVPPGGCRRRAAVRRGLVAGVVGSPPRPTLRTWRSPSCSQPRAVRAGVLLPGAALVLAGWVVLAVVRDHASVPSFAHDVGRDVGCHDDPDRAAAHDAGRAGIRRGAWRFATGFLAVWVVAGVPDVPGDERRRVDHRLDRRHLGARRRATS